jgi:hypothetical protein
MPQIIVLESSFMPNISLLQINSGKKEREGRGSFDRAGGPSFGMQARSPMTHLSLALCD